MNGKTEVVVGVQWGDEGKGRVVDSVAGRCGLIVRYQGGANAGHTVHVNGEKYVFHLLPSGMLYPEKTCLIGNGVALDPEALFAELDSLRSRGKETARLVVSGAAHVVMPYHKLIDRLEEETRGGRKIGTTGRGIGPCYADKYSRIGIRAEDLADAETLREKLEINLASKNALLTKIYGAEPLDFAEIFGTALNWGRRIADLLGNSVYEVESALEGGLGVLFEGAQATLLDTDYGTYPYVTSSGPCAGGACTGGGIGPCKIDGVTGVIKAYCTRVGEGPFPTEDEGSAGAILRERGGEYGATTGRPRRCGWLDTVAADYAVRVNGIDRLALTKLDVLSDFGEIKVCTAYELNGIKTSRFPTSCRELFKARPIYETLRGWREDISACREFSELPRNARDYVKFVEERAGAPVTLIGVGPERDDTIIREV